MDSIGSLLGNTPTPLPEVGIIKNYVLKKYGQKVGVISHKNHFTIICPSAALAGTLRMELLRIQKEFESDASLSVRIGQI